MKRYLRSRAGRWVSWSSLCTFVVGLLIGPAPAQAMGDSLSAAIQAYQGTHRSLSAAEMESISGAVTSGAPDPWEAGDKNVGGYGVRNITDGNELLSFPIVGYKGRGLSVNFGLTWNYGASLATPSPTTALPCGMGFTHPYNLTAVADSYGNVTITEADGRQRVYTLTSGAYVPPAGIHDSLVKNTDNSYTLTRKNQVQYHFSSTYADSKGCHLDTITDSNSNVITIGYSTFTVSSTTFYQATTITDPTSRVLTLAYNSSGLLSSITDPLSPTARVWNLTYDSYGYLTQISFPRVISSAHTTMNFTYSSGGMTGVEDRRGHTWTLAYGSYPTRSLTSVTDPYSETRSYSWNSYQGYYITDENGRLRTFSVDSSGRVNGAEQEVSHSMGPAYVQVDTKVWDSNNNLTSETDGNNNTTNYSWDSNGNKLTEEAPTVGGSNATTTRTYDSHNNCTSISSPNTYTTTLTYDTHNNLTGVEDALSHNTYYTPDTHGQITGIEDAAGHSEALTYDSNGNTATITDADSNETQYTFDTLSRLTERTDARSNVTDYSYDDASNLPTITYPDTSTVSMSYDANDNKTGMTDSHGSWSWTFDNDNRLTATSDPGSRTTGIGYDYVGNRTSLTRQDSTGVTYAYDDGGRLTSVTDSAISSNATTFSYDNDGSVTGMTLSNGSTVTKTYDAMERLSSITNKNSSGTTLSSYSYTYDSDSQRTGCTEADSSTMTWSYDHLHRLTGEVRTGTGSYSYSYTFDNAGNRLTWTDNNTSAQTDYTYDDANHLTAAGSYTYGYDADGNRTGSTIGGVTTTSTFDYEDRLTGIGSSASYSYIGASTDRYSKTASGTTTNFLYDGGSVDEEMQGSSYTAVYGAAAEKIGSTVSWMLQDGQGSTRQLLNSSQSITDSYRTDAYGNSLYSSGSVNNPMKWNGGSGYYSDAESGLQKVGARYYEPSTGRFISQDTMLIAGSPADSQALNRYNYCEGGPTGASDPSGHGVDWNMVDEGRHQVYEGYAQEAAGALLAMAAAKMYQQAYIFASLALDAAAGGVVTAETGIGAAVGAIGAGTLTAIAAGFVGAAGSMTISATSLFNGAFQNIAQGEDREARGYAGGYPQVNT